MHAGRQAGSRQQQAGRKAVRQADPQAAGKQACMQAGRQAGSRQQQAGRKTVRQADPQAAGKQAGKQAGRQSCWAVFCWCAAKRLVYRAGET